MKIQIASDLHFELWERHLPDPLHQFAPDESRDLLILAGDIVDGKRFYGMPFIHRELGLSPVILVPGNHEYYHARRPEVDAFWREFAHDNEDFYYLNDDTVEIAGLRVYGAEWCSDFWGHPPILFQDRIADFHLTPGWDTFAHLEEHQRITARIAGLAGKVDVVVTHFPPTLAAIDLALYEGDPNNGYFINDAEPLVRDVGAKLWVAGHTHSPFDYMVGQTRVVGNPRGYPFVPARPGFAATRTIEVNNADYTPKDDEAMQQVEEIGQKMEELIKSIERNGRKVATLTVEFEDDPRQRIKLCPVEDSQPRFELYPVEDPVAGADDIQAPDWDEEDLH